MNVLQIIEKITAIITNGRGGKYDYFVAGLFFAVLLSFFGIFIALTVALIIDLFLHFAEKAGKVDPQAK